MRYTNELGLPSAFEAAIKNDDYSAGFSDYTTTEIIDSVQKVILTRQHKNELVKDVSEEIYALLGKSVHTILERAEATAIVEKRLYMDIGNTKIGGKFDRLALITSEGGFSGLLQDYKIASVWEAIYGLKQDRINQQNVYSLLLTENDYKVDKLEIIMIFRDWQMSKAKFDPKYPQLQVARIEVPLWTEEKQLRYLQERVKLFKDAENGNILPCTDEERWYSGDKYAVMKAGRKSAVRVLNTKQEADDYIMQNELDTKKISVEYRPGVNRRCEDYCAVKQFCPQYQALKEVA
ncbi:MAG: hypothetical protein GY861_11795 [bacterium]|nr:hypothetical protein [bacterium]